MSKNEVVIPPADFSTNCQRSIDVDAAGLIYREVLQRCRPVVSSTIFGINAPTELQNVPSRLSAHLGAQSVDMCLQTAILKQINHSYYGESLLNLFGINRPDKPSSIVGSWQGPIPARVDQAFKDDLLRQLENLDLDPSIVLKLIEQYRATRLPEFVEIFNKLAGGETDTKLDDLFLLAQEMIFNPEFSFPDDSAESAYLLCYIDPRIRVLLRSILVANQLFRRMERSLVNLDEDAIQMLASLRIATAAHALTGQYWQQACRTYQVSPQTEEQMVAYSISELEAQRTLDELIRTPGGKRIIDIYQLARESLVEEVDQLAHVDEFGIFTNTDTGHGLNRFENFPATWAEMSLLDKNVGRPSKTGGSAVIYEDNETQARTWEQIIDKYTPYDQMLSSDTSELVLAEARRGHVGLYVIDIDNPEGEFAGIELAAELLEIAFEHYTRNQSVDAADQKRVRIVLWSSSAKLVEHAADHFRTKVVKRYSGNDVGFSIGGTGSSGRVISVVVCNKVASQLTRA
ncbi:hypothetical protein KC878_04645 [Candidatus Saccharibacteria bacterium]|nr:hypothetical protein [Candidatus Saccharibacteria bacterium]